MSIESRLARLEERSDNRDYRLDKIDTHLEKISGTLEKIQLATARETGMKMAFRYGINFAVGAGGVLAGYLGIGRHP